MHLFKKIEKEIHRIIQLKIESGLYPSGLSFGKVEVTPPREASHGDMATNAALILAPQLSKNPKVVAEDLVEQIKKIEGIAEVAVAGQGFINLTLASSVWQDAMLEILKEGRAYGNSSIGQGQSVNIEFVSANPTGPMHVGHGRGAVYGDALATLLIKAGYAVTREYYINDAGAQVDKVAESLYIRYQEVVGDFLPIFTDADGNEIDVNDFPQGLYPGEYLKPPAAILAKEYGKKLLAPKGERSPKIREFAIDAMMELIKSDLAVLGIKHDVFTSEYNITESGEVDEAIALLEKKGLIYRGLLEPPKGKTPDDWEQREQTLFKSTQFGDDCDRPVKKSDGSWTYFAPDIAYHYDKCKRGFTKLIDVFGADHGGYVKRIKAVVKALSDDKVEIDIKLCQLVKFMRDGEPLKMSKRAGTFVTVREVVDEVGKDVFRFIMLMRKNDVPLDFDFAKVMEQSKDNPVFYVQYAHARAHSIMRNAAAELPDAIKLSDSPSQKLAARLTSPEELSLIRIMCNWPRLVESAALGLEPHRVAFYLHDLAAAFHGFWNQGNDDLGLRFIIKHDIELSAARIALARAVSLVIASGLMVLGVEPMEEMR